MARLPVKVPEASPLHWALRAIGFSIVAYYLLGPILVGGLKPNEFGERTDILILALVALSLNLLIGFTGQISIGHSAFFGIGAYTLAILSVDHGWSPGWTYPMGALLCFAVGVLVGIPALRLKGLYLTLVTLALAQIFPALIRKFDNLTGGSQGIGGITYDAPAWTGLPVGRLGRGEWLYWVAVFMFGLGYVLMRNLVKSRFGRSMIVVRDNSTAAAVMGVNVAFTKTVVFGISAGLAGLAGCTFAVRQTLVTPENISFTILGSIIFLVVMVIGGTSSLLGPLVGAIVYYRVERYTRELPQETWLPQSASDFLEGRPNLATLVFAVLLILLMFVAPYGIVGLARRIGAKFVRVVPKPPVTRRGDVATVGQGGALTPTGGTT